MKVFITRMYGFDPWKWPVISFGREGFRDRLVARSRMGDVIAVVGTKTPETATEDQGRILGLAEIGRYAVDTLRLVDPEDTFDHDWENGQFRWPKALTMTRAWSAIDRPDLVETLGRQLPFSATYMGVELEAADAERILALRWEPAEVRQSEEMAAQQGLARRIGADPAAGPTTGPPPAQGASGWSRNPGEAKVYVLRYGRRTLWKVGYARDPKARCAEINAHVPEEETGEGWRLAYVSKAMPENEAYAVEQALLGRLADRRTVGERAVCPQDELEQAWLAALGLKVG